MRASSTIGARSRATRLVAGFIAARVWVAAAAVAAAALVASVEPARAQPTQLVTPPAGWRADSEHASTLAQRFAATTHFGGLPAEIAAEAYVADRPGAALFATRAAATLPAPADEAQAGRAARAALDGLRASSRRAALAGGAAEERSWQEHSERKSRQVTATLAWHDPASHTAEEARVVVASDGKRIVAVTGECVVADAVDAKRVAACRASLATLSTGIDAAQRVPIALAAAPSVDASPSPSRAGSASAPSGDASPSPSRAGSASASGAQSTMSAAPGERALSDERVRLPPMTIPHDARSNDRRTAYVGAGVVVLAVMFWWNRRRRDRFEREDRGAPPRAAARDDDADDLHAAARSEPPDRRDP